MNLSNVFANVLDLEQRRSLFKPFRHAVQASDVARRTTLYSYPPKNLRVPASDVLVSKFLIVIRMIWLKLLCITSPNQRANA